MMIIRIKALIIKELLAVLRDKRARFMLIIPPLMQLIIFANAATLEVRNISIVYFNEDNGWYSQEFISRIQGSSYFKKIYRVSREEDLHQAIDTQKAILGILIQSNFSSMIGRNNDPAIQII